MQATLATSGSFKPVTLNDGINNIVYGTSVGFQDSTSHIAVDEAQISLLDRGQALADHLDCLISIGNQVSATLGESSQSDFPTDTVLSAIAAASESANKEFANLHFVAADPGQLCRLEVPVELQASEVCFKEERTRASVSVEHHLGLPATRQHLSACLHRLRHHLRMCQEMELTTKLAYMSLQSHLGSQ